MQAHAGGDRAHAEDGGGLRGSQIIERDELEHCALVLGQARDRGVQPAGLGGGIDPFLDALDVVGRQQAPALDAGVRSVAARGAAVVVGDDVAGDAVQPLRRRSAVGAVGGRGVDDGEGKASAVRSAAADGSPTRRATNRCTASTCAR